MLYGIFEAFNSALLTFFELTKPIFQSLKNRIMVSGIIEVITSALLSFIS